MLEKPILKKLCQHAIEASIAAGKLIQSQVDQSYDRHKKEGGHSLASQVVTEVDFKAQEIILQHLRPSLKQYDLGLLTEETVDDASRLQKDYFWCIDPLDGTLPFTEQRPGYAVSIALISNAGDPVIGVVYLPDEDLCYSAIKGEGVNLNVYAFVKEDDKSEEELHLYLDRSMTSAGYFHEMQNHIEDWAKTQPYKKVKYHVGFGAVCNAMALLSHAHAGYFKFPRSQKGGGSIWDFAATRLIFEELGLPVSNISGEKLHLNTAETTFMHQHGVVYANNNILAKYFMHLIKSLS